MWGQEVSDVYAQPTHLNKPLGNWRVMYSKPESPDPAEQLVRQFARKHGRVTRTEVIDLCRIGEEQAAHLLDRLVSMEGLARCGVGRGVYCQVRKTGAVMRWHEH
jgi:hypothetical protein